MQACSALNHIDDIIYKYLNRETYGLLNGLGGCSLYFSNRFFQTKNLRFSNLSIEILEKIILEANQESLVGHLSLGAPASASSFLIDMYTKQDLLDVEEKGNSKPLINFVIDSITAKELEINRHDLFYGFLGKAIILLENDADLNRPYIEKIMNTLEKNACKDKVGLYWKTPDPFYPSEHYDETINLGIPHGSLGIILFLLKCCEIYDLHNELGSILNLSADWLIYRLNKKNNKLPYQYQYGTKTSGSGKLGWCYGDQAIAYTLLRHYEIFNREDTKVKAYELVEQTASKPFDQTGVQYYSDYGFYDLRICHGTSSVAYMYKKMYQITGDKNINDLANKWMNLTLNGLDIYLPQIDVIAEKEKNNAHIDTSMGFLNGLSGVGLVLMSFLDPKLSSWDKLLLLDRPGRE